jgi:hypothetical protein
MEVLGKQQRRQPDRIKSATQPWKSLAQRLEHADTDEGCRRACGRRSVSSAGRREEASFASARVTRATSSCATSGSQVCRHDSARSGKPSARFSAAIWGGRVGGVHFLGLPHLPPALQRAFRNQRLLAPSGSITAPRCSSADHAQTLHVG